MTSKIFGGAILATLTVESTILENTIKCEEDHLHIHAGIEYTLPNPGIGINAYNIAKIPLPASPTTVQFATLQNILK